MRIKPILIVAGEPNSIFVEILIKSLNKKIKDTINIKRNEQLNNYSNIYFNKVKKDLKIYEN